MTSCFCLCSTIVPQRQMATFKTCVFKHHKKEDGTYNVKIRVTSQRVKRYIQTPFYVTSKDLTRSCELKNQHYIDLCEAIISGYRKKLEPFGMAVLKMSVDRVVDIVTAEYSNCVLFTDVLRDYEKVRGISQSTLTNFKKLQKHLTKFYGKEDINLCELTSYDLQRWVLTMPPKSAGLYASQLSSLFKFAIKTRNNEEAGVKPIPFNPMERVEVKKTSHTDKKAISVDELRKVLTFQGCANYEFAKDVFLSSFFLVGMNLIDMYKLTKEEINGEFIEYYRSKTSKRRDDKAFMKILVIPEARASFLRIYEKMHSYEYDNLIKSLNYFLKKVGEILKIDRLVFYAARHTWATIAVNDCCIDKYTVHLSLNHVDSKTAITDVYIKKDFTAVDEANRKVADYVLKRGS